MPIGEPGNSAVVTDDAPEPYSRRLDISLLVTGALLSFLATAYGAGAALAVLLADAETPRQKAEAAIAAVPTLIDEWRDLQFVVDNREEIRDAVDYLEQNTPPRAQLEQQAADGAETLRDIEETYAEAAAALDAAGDLRIFDAVDSARAALSSRPDLDELSRLADTAEQVGPVVEEVQILLPVYYSGLATVNDNLADDELAATVGVMVGSLAAGFVVSHLFGFLFRRGRPGLVARTLQRLGARLFPGWYARNFRYALGGPVHEAARRRFRQDLLADPARVLDAAERERLAAVLADRRV